MVDDGEEVDDDDGGDGEDPVYIDEDEQTVVEGIEREILKQFEDAIEAQQVCGYKFCSVVCTNANCRLRARQYGGWLGWPRRFTTMSNSARP